MSKLFKLFPATITLGGIGLSAIAAKNQIDATNNQTPIHGNERSNIVNHYQKHGSKVVNNNESNSNNEFKIDLSLFKPGRFTH